MIDFASLPQNRRINRHENRFDTQFINMPEQFLGLLHLLYPHNAGKTLESPYFPGPFTDSKISARKQGIGTNTL
jgi:hypothetical protein